MQVSSSRSRKFLTLFLCAASLGCLAQAVSSHSPQHLFFRVTLGSQQAEPVSGRLLILVKPGTKLEDIEVDEFQPSSVSVAAKDVAGWKPGESVDIDTDNIAFPAGFSQLAPGDYVVQALLDTAHQFAYYGRVAGDIESAPTLLAHWTAGAGDEPQLTLVQTIQPSVRDWLSPKLTASERQGAIDSTKLFDFPSPVLTRFWGRTMDVRAWVVTPPGYKEHPKQHYPTVYFTHGFGATLEYNHAVAAMLYQRMAEGKMPPMIWVLLEEASPRGTHEFADSVNNGPWGEALTQEAIPALEGQYRMDAKASGRFLNGHSSGGWATLWLQVTYPKIFGGTWSTSPDPSDFHDFTGIDLYAPHANAYRRPDGTPYPIIRDQGRVLATFQELTQLEDVLGPYGGQISSFDWVFSPRGPGGRPEPMFNHSTGDVDPAVVEYWREHYDIAYRVAQQWPVIGPDLRGKVHVIVGTADTFYLDGAAHKLDAVFQSLHADEHFTFIPGRTHMDLYRVGTDRTGLFNEIARQMYAVARPKANWKATETAVGAR
ncbi:MAG: alpha/beta hydrolase [Acidobacteriaceae bacterium]